MAAITTLAAGAWSSTGTWAGGVIPGAGDTVTLNHAVSLTDARTVGTSPASGSATPAIQCNANLTITGTGVLTCRGDIALDPGNLITQPGFVFEFDASAASSPSTTIYVCGTSTFVSARITLGGSSGSRGTVRSNAGGANGRFAHKDVGELVADFCDFQRIGDSTHVAFAGATDSGKTIHLGDCTFDANCGAIGDRFGSFSNGGGDIELINVTHRGAISFGLASDSAPTGKRIIRGCRFVGTTYFFGIDNYDITDTMLEGDYFTSGGPWTNFSGNMLAMPDSADDWGMCGDASNSYVLFVHDRFNRHGVAQVDGQPGVIDGFIFDSPDLTDNLGDCITSLAPSAAQTLTVRNCIVLPTESGVPVGTLTSMLGGANLSYAAEHNTVFATNAASGILVGESYAGHVGQILYARSNLMWNPSANTAQVITSEAGVVTDVIQSANAHHNGKFNPSGTGYNTNLSYSSGSPGTGDIVGDPLFVDSTRNIKKWDAFRGGPGTVANALTELRKKNDPSGFDPNRTIADLRAYVRGGFVVQNTSMRTGAHDGTVMGANQNAPAGTPVKTSPSYGQPVPMRRGPLGLRRGKVFQLDASSPVPPAMLAPANPPSFAQPVPMRRGPLGLHRGRPFQLSSATSVSGLTPINGDVAIPLPLGTTATATVLVQADAAIPLPLGTTDTATVLVQAAAAIPLGLGIAAVATNLVQGTASIPLPLVGSADGTVLVQSVASLPLPLTVNAAGVVLVQGAVSITLPLTGAVAGTVLVQASASITLALSVAATIVLNIPTGPPYQMAIPMRPTAGGFAGGKPFAFSRDNPVPLVVVATGTANIPLPLTGSFTGTVQVSSVLAVPVPLALSAAGTVLTQAVATIPVPLTIGASITFDDQATLIFALPLALLASGTVSEQGALSLALPLALVSTVNVLVQALAALPVPLSAGVTGTVLVRADAALPLPLTLIASSALQSFGTMALPLPLAIVAAGAALVRGLSAAPLPLVLTASGAVTSGTPHALRGKLRLAQVLTSLLRIQP